MDHAVTNLPYVSDLEQVTPKIRRELVFRPQRFADENCYVIEDLASGRFFRIGLNEYVFVCSLDGVKTVRQALTATMEASPRCGFVPADAVAICQWVVQNGLAEDSAQEDGVVSAVPESAIVAERSGRRIGPLSMQFPLCYPDRFFERVEPWCGWLFSFPALAVWLLLAGWAVRDLIITSHDLTASTSQVIASGNWIWLGIVWLTLKVIHEFAHGVCCKRLGGEVREAGVILILFAPLAYVDVTSSWRLQSKWDRIQVALAGMYAELFIAAVATIVWCRTDAGIMHHMCFNIMTTASIMTLVFNANALMRFDGYYILSDALEMPNLYDQGRQYVAHSVRRCLFGSGAALTARKGVRRLIVGGYGWASFVWRNFVFVSLVLAAATLLDGAGIVLAILAVGCWLRALAQKAKRIASMQVDGGLAWKRCAVVTLVGTAGLVFTLTVLPWPGAVTAPAIVEYTPQTVVRAECSGFVHKVLVTGGQSVEAGEVLVRMSNDQLAYELEELNLSIRESRIKQRVCERNGRLAQSQAEGKQLEKLEQHYAEKQAELSRLTLHAPRAGRVVGRMLTSLEGTYLEKGDVILSIGNEDSKQIRMSIAQEQVEDFRGRVGQRLRAYLSGTAIIQGQLLRIEPRASTQPIDASLCAPEGGVLTVRAESDRSEEQGEPILELVSPHFAAIMSLDPVACQKIAAGQRAYVAVRPYESLGQHLLGWIRNWIDRRLNLGNGTAVVATDGDRLRVL